MPHANIYIFQDKPMRTRIVIDDELMKLAFKVTGLKTDGEIVEVGINTLMQLKQQAERQGLL